MNKNWQILFIETIEQALPDPALSVPFIAIKMGISERQLYRKVKNWSGLSPNRHIQICRLERGMELLQSGAYSSVKEVARALGYPKSSHFSDLFADYFGGRPTKYLGTNKRHLRRDYFFVRRGKKN